MFDNAPLVVAENKTSYTKYKRIRYNHDSRYIMVMSTGTDLFRKVPLDKIEILRPDLVEPAYTPSFKIKVFVDPDKAVARQVNTGTYFARATHETQNGVVGYKCTTQATRESAWNFYPEHRIEILRPELVKTPTRHTMRKPVQQVAEVEPIDTPELRSRIDLLVKSHVPTKAFLDYNKFLDDITNIVRNQA